MTDTPSNKIKPEHNPWYLLATLYGEAESTNNELHACNRRAWNRFMAAELTEDARALLIEKGGCSAEDLIRFSPEELSQVEKLFAERHRQATGGDITTEAHPPLADLKRHQFDFSNVKFDRPFLAKGFFFPSEANFSGSTFSDQTEFSIAKFFGPANFSDANFSGEADFRVSTFFRGADFSGTTFSSRANFYAARFIGGANFSNASFSEAVFQLATFSNQANFSSARFSYRANFYSKVDFSRACFKKTPLFVNAEMKGPTTFENAKFSTAPPQFFEAKLHQGTVWSGIEWPPPPKDQKEAEPFVNAYACLKLEMDRLKKHEDELDFFALEFQSRRVMHSDWQPVSELKLFRRTVPLPLEIPKKTITFRPQKLFGRSFALPPFTIKARTIKLFRPARGLAIALYGWLSDYGRSYVRPLCGLLITIAIGVLPFWWHLSGFFQAIGHSFANTFGVLGFRKDLISPEVLTHLPGWLKAVAAAQTIAGIVLLFLFGLAIRNRFRMK